MILAMSYLSFPLLSCWAKFTEVLLLAVHSILMSFRRSPGEVSTRCNKLVESVFYTYRPELHYMRGPGPKWCAKYQAARELV
jgi:hypothetical protein